MAQNISNDDINLVVKTILAKTKPKERDIKEKISGEQLFRFAYIPFVISTLVWDYADTICDLAAVMRIHEVKRLCRAVKNLRAEYDSIHKSRFDFKARHSEELNMYAFEDFTARITKVVIANIRGELMRAYPDMSEDELEYFVAVHQCNILLKALLVYEYDQRKQIKAKLHYDVGTILRRPVRALAKLIPEFIGDKPLPESFKPTERGFVNNIANQMALIGLSDMASDTLFS